MIQKKKSPCFIVKRAPGDGASSLHCVPAVQVSTTTTLYGFDVFMSKCFVSIRGQGVQVNSILHPAKNIGNIFLQVNSMKGFFLRLIFAFNICCVAMSGALYPSTLSLMRCNNTILFAFLVFTEHR